MRNIKMNCCALLLAAGAVSAPAQTPTTIFDIQFVDTLGGSDASPMLFQEVTVSGVITASKELDNLWTVHMQQPGLTEWAGIELRSGTGLIDLAVGDAVTVTGFVGEFSGKTVINSVSSVTVTGTGVIEPLQLDPAVFSNYSLTGNEKYESMLVRLGGPQQSVFVVSSNPDEPNNFGDWRVGTDVLSPDSGCRVLTGIQSSSTASSLNVSYINDIVWATNSGTLQVPPIVVGDGDEFQSITGIITYRFGDMRLLPRNNADVIVASDSDGDGVLDGEDNCTQVANAAQIDADGDGIGNLCDGDFNNDCIVNAVDLGLFKLAFFGQDPVFDLNSDGGVNALDLGLLKLGFFQPPGPSVLSELCD